MADIKLKEEAQVTAQDFAKEYDELCQKLGFRIVVTPQFVSTNHGSFEVMLNYSVGPLPILEK